MRIDKTIVPLIFGAFLMWPSFVVAQGEVAVPSSARAAGSAAYLRLGAGARAQGMGRARTAHTGGDLASAFWNPAGLGEVSRPGAVVAGRFLQDPSFDTQFFTGIGTLPLGDRGAAAVGILHYGVSDIEAFDSQANYLGGFNNSETALAGTYGISQGPVSIGGGVRYQIQEFSGAGLAGELSGASVRNSGIGFDLGLLYRINPRFSLGMVLRDGTDIGEDDHMPTGFAIGLGYLHPLPNESSIRAALDLEQLKKRPMRAHMGFEYGREMDHNLEFTLRLGVSDIYLEDRAPSQPVGDTPGENSKFTFGFGVSRDWYGVDVAYIADSLDDTILLSLSFSR